MNCPICDLKLKIWNPFGSKYYKYECNYQYCNSSLIIELRDEVLINFNLHFEYKNINYRFLFKNNIITIYTREIFYSPFKMISSIENYHFDLSTEDILGSCIKQIDRFEKLKLFQ